MPLYANDRGVRVATERLLPHASAIPNNAEFGVFWKAMYKGLESSWTGTTSVADAVKAVESDVKAARGDGIGCRSGRRFRADGREVALECGEAGIGATAP